MGLAARSLRRLGGTSASSMAFQHLVALERGDARHGSDMPSRVFGETRPFAADKGVHVVAMKLDRIRDPRLRRAIDAGSVNREARKRDAVSRLHRKGQKILGLPFDLAVGIAVARLHGRERSRTM